MPNHLASETSPYLLQHRDNPVDWYPWGEEALALAREQDKPILLSVGYSACHWCHVMAHESFEDSDVAALMNRFFINIKVDREERPDIDQIYQTALYMLTQRNGGWPLTLFLTPEQKPFFGGTYYPKKPRHGLPGFLDLLPQVAEAYYARGAEIERQSASLLEAFKHTLPSKNSLAQDASGQPIEQALAELQGRFDTVNGGFGDAPKFLHPAELEFCLRRHAADKSAGGLRMAEFTLQKMAEGGIYDQLGGGFCRYSTDPHWGIPHFEKMLYDNGPLLCLYAEAWLATGNPLFARVAEETAGWVMREMQACKTTAGMTGKNPEPEGGGYYSSLDADSEGVEGKFYVWNRDEITKIVTSEEYEVIAPYYGLTRSPNFEEKHWNLEIAASLADISTACGVSREETERRLASARRKMLVERERRIWPGRDEKILTSWNGLMIRGMARAGRVFGRDEWVQSAADAADFIRCSLWKNGRLLATCKDGKAHLNAYLDDHAFMLEALLELMQADFRQSDLEFAVALADILLEQFEDEREGGFFFTSHDHEKLIHRPKPAYDTAIPTGNGVAAHSLQRLGHLLGEFRYLQSADRTLDVFHPAMSRQASSCCSLLAALEQSLVPPQIVILRGPAQALAEWKKALRHCPGGSLVFSLPAELAGLPPSLSKPLAVDNSVNAWVCQGVNCLPAISDMQELLRVYKIQGKIESPFYN
jgi:uncharacterized protein YyaL (SSP411 family)